MRAEIITIGDEILIGQILDTNSAWMADHLNALGIHVQQITSISDREASILTALKLAAGRADLIIVTGGLGPTKDDVTKKSLCTYFECGLVRDEGVLQHVKTIFQRSNKPMLEVNHKQADVLEKADILFNQLGTAPGMWVNENGKIYIFLPGVPFEMKHLMNEVVIPRLKLENGMLPVRHVHFLIGGIGESFLAERLKEVEDHLPSNISLAYLPSPGSIRLRLTGIGHDEEALAQKLSYFATRIHALAHPHVVAQRDITLATAVSDLLSQTETTLSVAESCTGGNIAHLITAIPGSSQIFPGGVVSYSNEAKMNLLKVKESTLEEFGAVSEQTVREMASGCKQLFKSDYAVAVSGIAGPTGATENKPVGTVWIAIAGKHSIKTKLFQFGRDRKVNISRASAAALFELFLMITLENSD